MSQLPPPGFAAPPPGAGGFPQAPPLSRDNPGQLIPARPGFLPGALPERGGRLPPERLGRGTVPVSEHALAQAGLVNGLPFGGLGGSLPVPPPLVVSEPPAAPVQPPGIVVPPAIVAPPAFQPAAPPVFQPVAPPKAPATIDPAASVAPIPMAPPEPVAAPHEMGSSGPPPIEAASEPRSDRPPAAGAMHSPWMMEPALPPPVFAHSPPAASPAVARPVVTPKASASAGKFVMLGVLALVVIGGLATVGWLVRSQVLGKASRNADDGAVKVETPAAKETATAAATSSPTATESVRHPPQLATDLPPTLPPQGLPHPGGPAHTAAPTPPPDGKFDPSGI